MAVVTSSEMSAIVNTQNQVTLTIPEGSVFTSAFCSNGNPNPAEDTTAVPLVSGVDVDGTSVTVWVITPIAGNSSFYVNVVSVAASVDLS